MFLFKIYFNISQKGITVRAKSRLIISCGKESVVIPKIKPAGVKERNKIINAVKIVEIFINAFDLKSVLKIVRSDLMLKACNICIIPNVTNVVVIAVDKSNLFP